MSPMRALVDKMSITCTGQHVEDDIPAVCQGRGGKDTPQQAKDEKGCCVFAESTSYLKSSVDNESSKKDRPSTVLPFDDSEDIRILGKNLKLTVSERGPKRIGPTQ